MSKRKERLVRTTITLPASLKAKMSATETNWSEEIREMIEERLGDDGVPNMAEALILNERARRKAPAGWSSLAEIKKWRKSASS